MWRRNKDTGSRTEPTSTCSCHLGGVIRSLGSQPRPLARKRQWQIVASLLLLFFSYGFFMALARDSSQHGTVMLAVIGFFGCATFVFALLSAIVGLLGCDDCVSRM